MEQAKRTERTREKIMAAAMKEFGKRGYTRGSLSAICDEGISKGLIYHNYKNKDAIYLACVKHCYDHFIAYLEKEQIGHSLEKYMNARFLFFKGNELETHLFFEALLQPPAPLRKEIGEIRTAFDLYNRTLYLNILSTLTLRPDVTQEDALTYFTLMQNMYHCYFSSNLYGETNFSKRINAHEKTLPSLIHNMIYGIARDPFAETNDV